MIHINVELTELILQYAAEEQVPLTELRLLKFLYLADLLNSRKHKRTITNWPWFFHNFGPFSYEAIANIRDLAKKGVIGREIRNSTFADQEESEYSNYSVKADDGVTRKLERSFDVYVTTNLRALVRKYGVNSKELLHFVYTKTEPMIDAQPGDKLDFSLAEMPIKNDYSSTAPKLTVSQKNRAKDHLRALVSSGNNKSNPNPLPPKYDDVYVQSIDSLNREENDPDLIKTGKASVKDLLKKKIS